MNKINTLTLKNFRLYETQKITCQEEINYIEGINGSGKTSILEAIFLALTARSFRTNNYHEVIKKGKPFCEIKVYHTNGDEIRLVLFDKGKAIYLNNSLIKKISEFNGLYPAIAFSESDYKNFFTTPAFRRQYFDFEIAKFDPLYLNNLISFNKLLKERNLLLKNKNALNYDLLKIISEKMYVLAALLINARNDYIQQVNKSIFKYFPKWQLPVVKIVYLPNKNLDDLQVKLFNYEKDLLYEQTMHGPHKDDYQIMINEFNIGGYYSSGEQKITLWGLKMVLVVLFNEVKNILPIILIDDIFAELDEANIKKVRRILSQFKNQIFISTTLRIKNKLKE